MEQILSETKQAISRAINKLSAVIETTKAGQCKVLNSLQAQRYLNISSRLLKVLRDTHQLTYIKVGHKTILYRVDDLEDYLNKKTVCAEPNKKG